MNRFQRRIVLRVLTIHGVVILFLVLQSCMQGCFHPRPKEEIIIFTDFGELVSAIPQEVDTIPDSEPPPQEEPVEEPVPPVQEPVKIPELTQTPTVKPEPEKIAPPKQEVVKPNPPKKDPWKATPIDTSKSRKIEAEKPTISQAEINRAFDGVSSSNAKPGNPSEISAYDALIKQAFHNAWAQPAVGGARPAELTISITSTGRIKSWRLSRSSGDPVFDASVESAAKRVSVLPRKPPEGYPLDNNVIQFSLN